MIRTANNNDLKSLTELFIQLHNHHVKIKPETFVMPDREWFSQRILEILNDKEQTVFVYEDKEDNGSFTIKGYAVVKIMDVNTEDKLPRRICYINCFAIAEKYRRSGIGTKLFNAVKEYGRENSCGTVQLGVSACNESAVKFYEKMGLVPRTIQMETRI